MKTATIHSAKTHLSRLLKDVQEGETVVILHGKVPVGKITGIESEHRVLRPKTGTITSAPVKCSPDAFEPLTEAQLKEWGL
jgi:antitoxin (DNA-binding transcriptional repressor) of toxin-antitoxin stability system